MRSEMEKPSRWELVLSMKIEWIFMAPSRSKISRFVGLPSCPISRRKSPKFTILPEGVSRSTPIESGIVWPMSKNSAVKFGESFTLSPFLTA